MVIGLRFFHTLGIVGLFQDCERGGGRRILGPGEDFLSVLLLNVARLSLLQRSERLAALSSVFRQRPGISLYYTRAVPKRFILLMLPQGWFHTDRSKQPGAAGWGRAAAQQQDPGGSAGSAGSVPASSARSTRLRHSPSPRTSSARPGRSPQWSVR